MGRDNSSRGSQGRGGGGRGDRSQGRQGRFNRSRFNNNKKTETPPTARKTRSFKIRKRRLAHSFPLTAFKTNISITFMHYNTYQSSV
jgi:hypothetical protein